MSLREILTDLHESNIVLANVTTEKYQKTTTEILRVVSRQGGYWIYVTVNKPFAALKDRMLKDKIDISGVFFIDMAAGPSGINRDSNCLYLGNPRDLTSVSIAIDQAIYSMKHKKIVVFDSVNTLLNYNNETIVIRFLHALVGKMRMRNAKLILLWVGSPKENIISQLAQFCDKSVAVKGEKNV